jgi:hypothetical protein
VVDILRNISQSKVQNFGTYKAYLVHDTVKVRGGGIALAAVKRVNVQSDRGVVIASSIDVWLI